jgi:putative PIN family toxin of toxin-antitoxin system
MAKTKLFVIDTNILISAFILPHSVARKALNKAIKDGSVIISETVARELAEVFIRPKFDKYLSLEMRLEIIDDFISLAYLVKPEVTVDICRDPKDNQFLELACTANTACIVTGDRDLLVLHPFRGVPIITAVEFLNR